MRSTNDQHDDRDLVAAFIKLRDEASFSLLYDRYTPALYGMAVRLCGDRVDAQDAVQEAWIRACRLVDRFRWESTLRTWLTGILINCVREQSRRRSNAREDALYDEVEMISVREADPDIGLMDAIYRLPDGYRQVLVLHDIEGYTHDEIGEMLEIAPGTSKSQLHHARRAVRSLLVPEQTK